MPEGGTEPTAACVRSTRKLHQNPCVENRSRSFKHKNRSIESIANIPRCSVPIGPRSTNSSGIVLAGSFSSHTMRCLRKHTQPNNSCTSTRLRQIGPNLWSLMIAQSLESSHLPLFSSSKITWLWSSLLLYLAALVTRLAHAALHLFMLMGNVMNQAQ